MATAEATTSTSRRLKGDRELKQQLQILCRTDNWTNWLYLLRAYAIIAASIGGTIWLYYWLLSAGLSVWWAAPAALAAIMVIGASQHQLAGATHEATHHTLFKGRMLNELVSDWLCMFPVFSTTYSFRLYHLIHHQFVNDPDHDPDFVVLAKSGHWLDFPVSAAKFLGMLAKQALILPLLRYILVRFRFNAVGVDMANAYKRKEKSSKLPERIGFLWLAGLLLMQVGLTYYGDWRLAAAIPPEFKLNDGGKGVLKDAARLVVPHEVIDRKKGYFPVPQLKYIQGDYLDMVRDALTSQPARDRGLFAQSYLDQLFDDPVSHITPLRGSELWQVALLEMWLQTQGV